MGLSSWKFKLRYAGGHLAISTVVVGLAAGLTFGVWYPWPFGAVLGVGTIFGLAVLVDLVCGPLITGFLASPKKSKQARWVDFSLVGLLQLGALAYALHSVYVVRPVAVVFDVDRFVVVSANEVQTEQLPQPALGLETLPKFSQLLLGARALSPEDDLFLSVQQSMAGFGPATRPSWWRSYDELRHQVKARMRAVSVLQQAYPSDEGLKNAIAKTGLMPEELSFLPLTSSREKGWVVLMNAQGDLLAYARVDGFLMQKSTPGD